MKEELRLRAKALWPEHIPVENARIAGRSLIVTSRPVLTDYPARLSLTVTHGEPLVTMTQNLPKCGDRSWDLTDEEAPRALKAQWSGIMSNVPSD